MSQTSVPAAGQPIGFAGQLADNSDSDIVSGVNEDTAQMPFGFGVRQASSGTSAAYERFYSLPTGFSTVYPIQGVVLHGYDHAPAGAADSAGRYAGDLGASGLLQNSSFDLLRKGRVLVPVEQAVRVNDRAWCRGIATGALSVGMWVGTDLGASYHVDCTRQAVFRSASYTAADGTTLVAVLECDFTNRAS
jgi:hypothetical protein